MFGWLFGLGRRKRETEFVQSFARAAAAGSSRAMINRALAACGANVPPPGEDDNQYCITASKNILALVRDRSERTLRAPTSDERLLNGLFAMVIASHTSHLVGAQFEIVSGVVALDAIGFAHRGEIRDVIDFYNRHAQRRPDILLAIGRPLATWIADQSEHSLARLVQVYRAFWDAEIGKERAGKQD